MKEFVSAVEDIETEDGGEDPSEKPIIFKLDGREVHAYQPLDGQLAFMLGAMGRGQSQDQRFGAIVNIILSCLRDSDKDWIESRLLTRDKKNRLPVAQVEAIFEYLIEEWFARPTQPSSGSAPSPHSDGENSTPPTTPATS